MTHPQYAVQQQHRASVVFGLGLSSLIINVVGCCSSFDPLCPNGAQLWLGILGWIFGRHDLRAMHAGIMDQFGIVDHQIRQNSCHGVASPHFGAICLLDFDGLFWGCLQPLALLEPRVPKADQIFLPAASGGKLFSSLTSGADWF